jgi:dienelactone hydrolase
MAVAPDWERRFTAPAIGFPQWTAAFPERLAITSNRSGIWQVWTVGLPDGAWRQVTDEPVGVEHVWIAPDGRAAWWHDETGDECGSLFTSSLHGAAPEPLTPDLPDGWMDGVSFADERLATGVFAEGRYRVYVSDVAGLTPSRLVYSSDTPAGVGREYYGAYGGLSADGELVCVRHTEHGDILRYALRVLDASGDRVGDLLDAGHKLDPAAWSPVPGDARLAFTSELGDFERPAIWNPVNGERRDLDARLPGAAIPVDWWPDGSALLVRHEHEGRAQLFRLELDSEELTLVCDPVGSIDDAAVRPDGEIWLLTSGADRAPRLLDARGVEVFGVPEDPPPPGRPYRSWWFPNPHGERIQAFLATPEGDPPFPTVVSVHGGPEWHERDAFDPEAQAFADAGYAVALPNYRGSTGYGIAFREALIGDPCFPESEDVLACVDHLVAEGLTDPDLVFWSGWSWGGCLACLNAGLHPDRWRAVFAGIPAGDFVAAHWASAPALQAWDDAVYGGSPDEVPERYRERDPMTYASRVTAPVLIIAGTQDSRCPVEGIDPWVEAVRETGAEVEVEWYEAGHHANAAGEQVAHMRRILGFFGKHGGPSA